MKRLLIANILLLILIICTSWGFYSHKRINKLAVFTLPNGMIRFYKNNITYINEHAVDADKRRYADSAEAPRHFLDADRYGISPFDSLPSKWKDAVEKYSEKTLQSNGIVPWQIERSYRSLVKAFMDQDSLKILKHSSDLGHYIGDAHVPLHTTENYNGQLTNQTGLHAFWESRLPELFADDYDYFVGRAEYIEDPLAEAWKILRHTFSYKDSVLLIEARLNKSFAADQKYTFAQRNGIIDKQYSAVYSKAFHDALDHMVENQMRSSIHMVGSFWYSAWIDAGQPDLNHLKKEEPLSDRNQTELEEQRYLQGKIIGRAEN